MVTKFDVFYVIAEKGPLSISEITKRLKKKDQANMRKLVLELEKEGFVLNKEKVSVVLNDKGKHLYHLITFCIKNGIGYNRVLYEPMLKFLKYAAKKEYFTFNDIPMDLDTVSKYVQFLSKNGLVLVTSKKPLKAKLLQLRFYDELFSFFNMNIDFYTIKRKSLLKEICKEIRKFKKQLNDGFFINLEYEKKEQINFIHMSLSLEGNPLTLADTQQLISKEIVPTKYRIEYIEDVRNYKRAVDLMIEKASTKEKLTLQLILDYHRLAMIHLNGAGQWRKQNVKIQGNSNFKTADWKELDEKLLNLIKRYEEFEGKKKKIEEVIKFAAFFHNEFQRIHPFVDGNSRTSRLLLLHILRYHELPVLDIPLGYFDSYMEQTKLSKIRNDEEFAIIIEEIVLFNLKKVNSLG